MSSRAGQAVPPFDGCTVMVRVRDRWPPPQPTEHLPQADHADTSQFTGAHGAVPGGHVVVPNMYWKQDESFTWRHGPALLPKQSEHMPLPFDELRVPTSPKLDSLFTHAVEPAGQSRGSFRAQHDALAHVVFADALRAGIDRGPASARS